MIKALTMQSTLLLTLNRFQNMFSIRPLTMTLVAAGMMLEVTLAHSAGPTIRSRDLPSPLYDYWAKQKPDMGNTGHCAVAFDSSTDERKMAYGCSVFIKMSAQGERKALQYCETMRETNQVKAPCQLVVD